MTSGHLFLSRALAYAMMAARALSRVQRVTPKAFSLPVSHRCTLPAVTRVQSGNLKDGRRREKRQIGGADNDSQGRATALILQSRDIHATRRNENTIILAGLGVAASAMAARYGLKAYNNWSAGRSKPGVNESPTGQGTSTNAGAGGTAGGTTEGATGQGTQSASSSSFFGSFGKKHYEGGFDDKMTRREAALILGVRESAAPQRIKDAHRRILMINHPDKGGSKYMAAKINEAKEILLKGRT